MKDKKIIRRTQEGEYDNAFYKYLKLTMDNEVITLNLTEEPKDWSYFKDAKLLNMQLKKYLAI